MYRRFSVIAISSAILTVMLLASATIGPITAASNSASTFPVARAKQLGGEWWRWAFSFPTEKSPLADKTGAKCAEGDQGKVFFLAGIAGPLTQIGKVERTCPDPISKDQSILVPIANAACLLNTREPIPCLNPKQPVTDFKELQKQTKESADLVRVGQSSLILDDKPIDITNSRTQTQRFDVTVADSNPFDGPPDFPVPGGNYIATADGYWALLKPLSVGNHDLHIKGVIEFLPNNFFVVDVTYHLTVE